MNIDIVFDFNRDTPTALQSIFCLLSYLSVLIICYKDYYRCKWIRSNKRVKLYWYVILMPILYSLTNFVDTDYFHYFHFVSNLSRGIQDNSVEIIYHNIAKLTLFNYISFRLVIWGIAFLLLYNSCVRFKIKPDFVFYTIFILYVNLFTYARASLGMAVAFWGITIVLTAHKNIAIKIGGIVILLSSLLFHSSMIIVVACCLIAYLLKWSKRWIIEYLIAIPCLTMGIRIIMDFLLNLDGIEGLIFSKLSYYSELESTPNRTLLGKIQYSLEILSFIVPLYIMTKNVYFKSRSLYLDSIRYELSLYKIAFVLVSLSIAFLFVGLQTEVFSYRVRYMAIIPIVLSLCSLTIKKIIKRYEYQLCLLLGSATILMSLISSIKNA